MSSTNNTGQNHIEVLIVEDNPVQALLLQRLLEKSGYTVSVACNGVEALAHLQKHIPSLVISDILMPEMDGYELCRKIKAHDGLKSIPVMLLTQLSEPEDIIRGLECGADNFVTKPYDKKSLIPRIRYILVNQEIRKRPISEMGIEIYFAGNKHFINSDRLQILDLLFSTYENTLQQKQELEITNKELKEALETIKILKGLIPICSNCKKIRYDKGYWNHIEAYIQEHSEAEFSHGICPECAKQLYPDLDLEV